MKVLSISSNYNYLKQNQKQQKENVNFGATVISAKEIPFFKRSCPDAVSLTDESLYTGIRESIRTKVFKLVEEAQNRFLNKKYGSSLQYEHLRDEKPHVFLFTKDRLAFLDVLRKADDEIVREPSTLAISDVFEQRWEKKEGNCGILRYVVENLLALQTK